MNKRSTKETPKKSKKVMKKATRKSGGAKPTPIDRDDLEEFIYREVGLRRFTQDSPVLPDVWFEFGMRPTERVDLLLTPHWDSTPGELARQLIKRLKAERAGGAAPPYRCDETLGEDVAFNQSTVVARLCFGEVVRIVLPMTHWWKDFVWLDDGRGLKALISDGALRKQLADALRASSYEQLEERFSAQLLWMMKIVGAIALASVGKYSPHILEQSKLLVDSCAALMKGMEQLGSYEPDEAMVWSVTRNRKASIAMWRSTVAIKADAARRLFEVSCKDLSWAVIDSGIDAEHPAFRDRNPEGVAYAEPFEDGGKPINRTRIKATYDFSIIRYLLREGESATERLTPPQQKRLAKAQERIGSNPLDSQQLRESILGGRYLNWDFLLPLLEVPHQKGRYEPPPHSHGTHVAGILAADWKKKDDPAKPPKYDLEGVCPDLRLYDLRVLDENGEGDEFAIIAALQFVRHFNAHRDYMAIHGVNLSFSLYHDIANFACGSTPICEECTRLTGAGIVVVAAAGNEGYLHYLIASGKSYEGYRSISITDPGNTEEVITVGSTHREHPHTYGVSYFSSRGPTGDGRIKPDLVAPGEKIVSTVPNRETKRMDGTSMASPHVSGAAALLMARYKELIGRPKTIKEVLCRTATDLGRERYFQGAGMLDILRALQAV